MDLDGVGVIMPQHSHLSREDALADAEATRQATHHPESWEIVVWNDLAEYHWAWQLSSGPWRVVWVGVEGFRWVSYLKWDTDTSPWLGSGNTPDEAVESALEGLTISPDLEGPSTSLWDILSHNS